MGTANGHKGEQMSERTGRTISPFRAISGYSRKHTRGVVCAYLCMPLCVCVCAVVGGEGSGSQTHSISDGERKSQEDTEEAQATQAQAASITAGAVG